MTGCWVLCITLTVDWPWFNTTAAGNRGIVQHQLWSSIPFEFSTTWTQEACEACSASTARFRSCFIVRQSNRNVVTNAQRQRDSGNIWNAGWDCSGLFRQSTIRKGRTHRLPILFESCVSKIQISQLTAPECLLQSAKWISRKECLSYWALYEFEHRGVDLLEPLFHKR